MDAEGFRHVAGQFPHRVHADSAADREAHRAGDYRAQSAGRPGQVAVVGQDWLLAAELIQDRQVSLVAGSMSRKRPLALLSPRTSNGAVGSCWASHAVRSEAVPTLVSGLMLGLDSIGADEYMRAIREFSAAIGQRAILADQHLAGLGRRLRQAERAGKPLAAGPAGQPLIARQPIGQVPFELICKVRDQLAIMAEVAADAAMSIAATRGTRASSLRHEPAFRLLERARASSPAVRAYLLFSPPVCTAEPSHAWKQMTRFIVLTCTHPACRPFWPEPPRPSPPSWVPLRELAGRARASFPERST